ncbi:uncharacterized protein TRUGW13939_01963 [Talaromyces rugulosus]|uniref:HNH nuclease domain-containing protein n=1 Tax=Talaromyces rugulosus TaxID=121627 RepID=A0A7H8QNX1_TALRU|nr:uncharacterized protein TRUGW13939_01963 [Talaromyces rugulosus]QKX54873.1 hypothetical protein TRUGW13939_01963 [Talaromyces rugulosus]
MSSTSSRMGPPPVRTNSRSKRMSSEASANSGSFTTSVKLSCREYTKNSCWFCDVEDVIETAHVVAKEDRAIRYLFNRGLINFSLTSALNGVALCPTCHTNFGNAMDPGWFFVPADLDFFIQKEKVDMERRQIAGDQGKVTNRICPTSEEYAASQPDGVPLYTRVLLHPNTINPPAGGFKLTAPWNGSPMAAIRRAFVALGSIRRPVIPQDIAEKLWMLQDLYHRDPEVKPQCLDAQADEMSVLRPLKRAPDEDEEPMTEMSMSPTKRTRAYLLDDDDEMWDQENRRRQFDTTGWVLGPDSTSDTASKRFRPLFN